LISSSQIKAARSLLGISAAELSEMGDIPHRTIQRVEAYEGVPPSRGGTLERLKATLEAAGIEFIGDPVTSPGVRLHPDKRPE
jgi:ribosome-binding protein aMBF1 (putative translation factor)